MTRYGDAIPYDAPGHVNVSAVRLQGLETSPSKHCWVGLSHYPPQGRADSAASDVEKIYVVLSGEITVITDSGEATLSALDSCYLAAGERRAVINRAESPASILVIMGTAPPAAAG
ncbi:MAG: cupin domain-containing protein [Steroidobacteraceae bacterium]